MPNKTEKPKWSCVNPNGFKVKYRVVYDPEKIGYAGVNFLAELRRTCDERGQKCVKHKGKETPTFTTQYPKCRYYGVCHDLLKHPVKDVII